MSKAIFELQENIKYVKEEIQDVLHLSYLNHQSILCLNLKEIPLNQTSTNENNLSTHQQNQKHIHSSTLSQVSLKERHQNIESQLKILSELFDKRSQNHLNYLITRQIQGEEESVRRDRLTEYEERIYDQRRLISDKEVFCESLFRPKKQRPQHMTSEEFQQLRLAEKQTQEKAKLTNLQNQVKSLQTFKKKIFQASETKIGKGVSNDIIIKRQIEMYGKTKNDDLQKTKAHSLQTVNLSAMNNLTNTQKPQKPFEEEQLNSDASQMAAQNDQKKIQSQTLQSAQASISQKGLGKYSFSAGYSISIEKLIKSYEKSAVPEEGKEKFLKIGEILWKIKQKKLQNSTKRKQWKELYMENAHMKAHLKKTKQLYLVNKASLTKNTTNKAGQ